MKSGYEKIDAILTPLPPEFISAGLEYLGTDIERVNERQVTNLIFANQKSGIKLEISLKENGRPFAVFIKHPSKHSIELHRYLTHHKRKSEYSEKFFRAEPAAFITELRRIIRDDWHDMITGKRWEEIPFDWTSY